MAFAVDSISLKVDNILSCGARLIVLVATVLILEFLLYFRFTDEYIKYNSGICPLVIVGIFFYIVSFVFLVIIRAARKSMEK
jgi:hypothetical protein